jgi:predicted acyl esterase
MRVGGLTPGQVRRVTLKDFGDHWVFNSGHAIRLKVSNIDFPDFRPPAANDNLPSEITLRVGKAHPSVIRLPVGNR